MAVIETSRPVRTGGSAISRLISAVISWNETRVTRNALHRLSDRELDDIGLSRGDIERSIR